MSRCRRSTCLAQLLILVGVAIFGVGGCQTVLTPLSTGREVHVEPGNGILVVETFSNSDIENLRLAGSHQSRATRILKNLPKGHHVHLVELPEGNYRWALIELPGWTYKNRSYPVRWQLDRAEQWQISVKAGQVNYPGMIALHRSAWSYLAYRVVNRSGELLDSIEDQFPGLLDQYAIRYGGAGRDDFLEYYHEALRSLGSIEATSGQEVPVVPGDL